MFKPKPNEQVIRVVRRYILTHIRQIAFSTACFFTAFFFLFWFFSHGWWGQAIFFVLLSVGVISLTRLLVVRYRNVSYITSHRVVDIDRRDMFHCVVSDIPYDQIEDVAGQIDGFWGTLFRFGSVHIQTAGGTVRVVIDRVRRPVAIQELINDMRELYIESGSVAGSDLHAAVRAVEGASLAELRTLHLAVKRRAVELRQEEQEV